MGKRLYHYNNEINEFSVDDALSVLDCSFPLTSREVQLAKEILTFYHDMFSDGYGTVHKCYYTIKEDLKTVKEMCESDWIRWMHTHSSDLKNYSPLNRYFISEIAKSPRSESLKDNIVHTILRVGEFYYILDREMEELGQDMDSFIESGDCKLFDYENCPYGDKDLLGDLEVDIKAFEPQIQKYLEKDPKNNTALVDSEKIIQALHTIRKWILTDLDKVPEWARGIIQICKEIKSKSAQIERKWKEMCQNGIPLELIMSKRSGFCLNKESFFREFLEATKMPSWKNPEGSCIAGYSKFPFPEGIFKDMLRISQVDMDVIYYSLGKGPWLKTRYVGQPISFYQNVAELLASTIKQEIQNHTERYSQGEAGVYSAELINIYDNYYSLKDMIIEMKDSIALDFSSYSDYLNRDTFDWIMTYMWGVPKEYRMVINHLMALPIKVNGKIFHHKHGSVMGIKVNFLLITFANCLMWMVSNILSICEDKAKFMGDDRITINHRNYTEEEVRCSMVVLAYFNCVVNYSKSEWLSRDGFTSFCKRTFNREGIQISGLGGEFLLKQKPFLNDLSVWENVCSANDIAISPESVSKWAHYWSDLYLITYLKFSKSSDPSLQEMIHQLIRIPFRYGGWSLEEPDDIMDQIMLKSIMAVVSTILEETEEEGYSPEFKRVEYYLQKQLGIGNRYYQNFCNSSSYSQDYLKIKELIDIVVTAIDGSEVTKDDLIQARRAARRLEEIVLQRDTRLASSSSTKNRIDYKFDQDRVSKIRANHLVVTLEESLADYHADILDSSVLKECLNSKEGIQGYLRYIHLKSSSHARVMWYSNFSTSWLGMVVERINPNGTVKQFWKRLETWDSDYERAHKDKNGYWTGKFVTLNDLTKEEEEIYHYLRKEGPKKFIQNAETTRQEAIVGVVSYVKDRLTDLVKEIGEEYEDWRDELEDWDYNSGDFDDIEDAQGYLCSELSSNQNEEYDDEENELEYSEDLGDTFFKF